jgi:hypothetical protein
MNLRLGAFLLGTALVAAGVSARADDIKSGPEDEIGGPFDIRAFTGAGKGKKFCYV